MSAQKDADGRDRILRAAVRLIAESGGEPVSTRAICAAAGVGAPTLYHHFGDKQGLFDAVAAHGLAEYLAGKRAQPATGDPVDDLRRGWDLHVDFGLRNPAFYVLMYRAARTSPAVDEAYAILLGLVGAVARAGRLRVPVETAAQMIQAAGVGVVLALIAGGDDGGGADEGGELSVRTREAVLAAVTVQGDPPDGGPGERDGRAAAAVSLRAALAAEPPSGLSPAEQALLAEWLDRIAG
ncbi:TetR/AcrR family transcriptional regulator [Actinomadura violacea]|uniref:TetR/AcrR family transcriptional regulator n=1 Tax=Actinomadura violacea TaxID=2819934 RepID=A0ABS3RKX3_9ACTN|nr:TetR/AcrR family transcriptional regulator [Actinomadura violacea]MBO2457378.1 TetR/AcrR family transcriptional regulator [Actinomadura violacea]